MRGEIVAKRKTADVIVVGGGNAALCAAISAREAGVSVTLLEAAPQSARGGNSHFAAGGIRFVHEGLQDLLTFLPELQATGPDVVVPRYTVEDFFEDLGRDTNYLADPDESETLILKSRAAISWLHDHGMTFHWTLGVHAHQVNGTYSFPAGLCVAVDGGGEGLVNSLYQTAEGLGVAVEYASPMNALITDERGRVAGVVCQTAASSRTEYFADKVILACGGFESDPSMRARYLGPNWDLARVRGTRFNMGAGLRAALEIGAEPFGNWSGCHAIQTDINAPWFGDRTLTDVFQRQSYRFGIMVNTSGRRWLDEGADFDTHTYAKYGREVLNQRESTAFQIFDSQVTRFFRSEYNMPRTTHNEASSIEDLANQLQLDAETLRCTVDAFNQSIEEHVAFNPNALDGKRAGVAPPKSHWAVPLTEPPFHAYPVTTGITFTFGGLHVDTGARVFGMDGRVIPGLYAAGETVGGLFYGNYPSGTGLGSGTVFGCLAGQSAAADQL